MDETNKVAPVERWTSEKFDRPHTANVPDELQRIDFMPKVKPFDVIQVPREELSHVTDKPVDPFVPDWVDVRSDPGRALDYQGYAPKVRLRGREVTPAVVFPPDDRTAYDDFSYPWGCVCRVVTSAGTLGSGMLVGPNHVLTASHVVNWNAPNGVDGVVEVQRNFNSVAAISRITRVHAYHRVTGSVRWLELDEDYAVLETEDPIGTRFGYVGITRYDSDWDRWPVWSNVGYPGDRGGGRVPQRQTRKWLDEHAFDRGGGRAMDTDADINPGNSGGPMFARFSNGGVYIVAVVSAHDVDDRENYCSGGSDIVRLVRHARS